MIAMAEPPAIIGPSVPGAPAPQLVDPETARQFYRGVADGLATKYMTLRDYQDEAWKILEPQTARVRSWADDCIAEHLEAVTAGEIKRLIINIKPRMGKSYDVTISWPTWEWGPAAKPWMRYLIGSYAANLSTKHSKDRRDILESDWYLKHWGNVVQLAADQNEKNQYENTARGVMAATSVGGTATGKGGNRIIIDDPQNPEEAASQAALEAAARFYDQTLSTRLNNKKRDAIVVVMQRLHHRDLTGHILSKQKRWHTRLPTRELDGWVHLAIPAEAEDRRHFVFPRSGTVKVMEPGEILCPEREDRAELDAAKTTLGTRGYQAQYQQGTSADEGGLLQRKWWRYYRPGAMPPVRRSIWFLDTAMEENQEADRSAGVRINWCTDDNFYIDRAFADRLAYPDLKRTVVEEHTARPASVLAIEHKVSGISLGQDLKRSPESRGINVVPFKFPKDKVFCVNLVSPLVEAGRVFLLEGTAWAPDFVAECAAFPAGDHDDYPDAFAKGLMYLRGGPGAPVAAMSQGNLHTQGQTARADWM